MKKYFPTLWLVFKVLAGIAAALAVLILLASLVLSIYGSRELNAVRAEAAARGVPLSMKELMARRPVIPEDGNAANLYEAAFSLLPAGNGRTEEPVPMVSSVIHLSDGRMTAAQKAIHDDLNRVLTNRCEAIPEYILEATRKYVDGRRAAIDLICKAATFRKCSYHVDWLNDMEGFSRLYGPMRQVGWFMSLAAWLDAEEGRAADAAAKIRATIALGSSLTDEPNIAFSVWNRSATLNATVGGLMRVVSRANISNDDLLILQKDLERFAAETPVRNPLEIDLATMCDQYAAALESRTGLYSVLFGYGLPSGMTTDRKTSVALYSFVWLLRGAVRLDEAAMIKCYLAFLDNPGDPGTASMKAADEVAAIIGETWRFPARKLPSTVHSDIRVWSLIVPRAEGAAAALAALRCRNNTGKWPETLDALLPEYIQKVPVELFTNQPLAYTVLPDGIIVYSRGKNGVDDGGKPWLVEPAANDPNRDYYDDVGFRIQETVEQRKNE